MSPFSFFKKSKQDVKNAMDDGNAILGNTSGNYANDALLAKDNDNIFYVTSNNTIFKMKADVKDHRDTGLVSGDPFRYVTSLSIIDRMLYYAVAGFGTGLDIYKAHIDAKEKSVGPSNYSPILVFSDPLVQDFRGAQFVGNWIIYSTPGGLFRVDTRNMKRELLAEGLCSHKGISGDTIYFQVDPLYSQLDQLHKIGINGQGHQTILPQPNYMKERLNSDDHRYSSINVSKEWLYYISYAPSLKKRVVHKARLDGHDETMLNDKESASINVAGDWIYFINKSDYRRLYRISTDGTQEMCLDSQQYINSIHVLNDLAFCYFSLDAEYRNTKMFSIQTDGSNRLDVF